MIRRILMTTKSSTFYPAPRSKLSWKRERLSQAINRRRDGEPLSWSALSLRVLLAIGLIYFVTTALMTSRADTDSSVRTTELLMQRSIGDVDVTGQKDVYKSSVAGFESTPTSEERIDHLHVPEDEKAYILNLLEDAGIPIDPIRDSEIYDELPTWKEVVDLFGDKPIIVGLDRCEEFQTHSDAMGHFVGTAGTFNTGTNLLAELLISNCEMPPKLTQHGIMNHGVRWQVPWGKHSPPGNETFRIEHKTHKEWKIDAHESLPVVTIRDPLVWLGSMCHHRYAARWKREVDGICPNFSAEDLSTMVKYAGFNNHHDSILHLWNDYYDEYMDAEFPRLIVRFEDLIFHAKEVIEAVCECAGGTPQIDGEFKYSVTSAKKEHSTHGRAPTTYLDSIIRYGSAARRYNSFSRRSDLEYVRDNVNKRVMDAMRYAMPDVTKFD